MFVGFDEITCEWIRRLKSTHASNYIHVPARTHAALVNTVNSPYYAPQRQLK
jgi:hypothetical protein